MVSLSPEGMASDLRFGEKASGGPLGGLPLARISKPPGTMAALALSRHRMVRWRSKVLESVTRMVSSMPANWRRSRSAEGVERPWPASAMDGNWACSGRHGGGEPGGRGVYHGGKLEGCGDAIEGVAV